MNLGDAVFLIALAATVGMSLYYSKQIKTDRMPMQWSLGGMPTWFAPKLVGLWFMVFVMLGCRLLIIVLQARFSAYVHGADTGLLLLSFVAVCGHFLHMRGAARWAARQEGAG